MKTNSSRQDAPAATRWWLLTADEALQKLDVDRLHGLTDAEAHERRSRDGFNELEQEPPVPLWKRMFDHLNALVVWILIIAAVVSAAVGDWIDTAAILAIVALNVAIGVFQEERADRALAALRQLSAPMVRALRDGALRMIAVRELVPGDIVELEAGDKIPADVRLVKSASCRAQEAALTGESAPVDKDASSTPPADAQLADRSNMAFMGAAVAAGRATGVVVATGMATELGQIAGLLQRYEREPTPLERRLAALGRVLIVVCLAIVAVVFALHLYRGGEFVEVLLLSISLAVAAVPEGMPAIVTLTLALGLQRMVRRNALIRKLPSVETLGAVTVICTDKTGTLTRNEMTVREVEAGGVRYAVSGTGYAPQGQFSRTSAKDHNPTASADEAELKQALLAGARCNDASLQAPADDGGCWSVVGDPTEGALLVAAHKAGVDVDRSGYERLQEIPFDSERKAMSVVVREEDAGLRMYAKGAPEVVLQMCSFERRGGAVAPLSSERCDEIRKSAAEMASRALRVLALAYRELDSTDDASEQRLAFAGLVGMIDPPREEVADAVDQCRTAGIRPIMITGDHPDTAIAISRELGIVGPGDELVTGAELDQMSDDELTERVSAIAAYARVSASHKLRVVKAWQRRDQVVAMTGDGVNDAPALKAADVGIAMGRTGAEVTKETADMVLTDDNFATIINAVEEGRGIFDNIQKSVHYLLSCNASEVLLMLIAGVAGWPPPLSALQILWINLVTDGFPALALGVEPPERHVMRRDPRARREPVIGWKRGTQIVAHGLLMAAISAAAFWWIYRGDGERLMLAQSSVFCIVAYMQLFYSLSCRSQRETMPEIGVLTNPFLLVAILASLVIQTVIVATPAFRTVFAIDDAVGSMWPLICVAALAPPTIIEGTKLVLRAVRYDSRQSSAPRTEAPANESAA